MNGVYDSYELALMYSIKREVPFENMLALNGTVGNNVGYYGAGSYQKFMNEVVVPLKGKLDYLDRDYALWESSGMLWGGFATPQHPHLSLSTA